MTGPACPTTPMTGSGRRRLSEEGQPSPDLRTQQSVYIPPSTPEQLAEDSDPKRGFAVRLARRRYTGRL